jgi:BirA family transcriptional regulator, biotin operon repressor / biotin---[acetyl-CoA-carboxylase] ligase
MNAKVIQWPAESIWEQIAPILPHFTVEVLPEIDSSNTELMRRAKAGQIEPILLIAEKQTAGRGRLGREWHDLAARTDSLPALTFSLGMPLSPLDWSGLSLAAGISIAQSLHPKIGLKWPNDLWISADSDDENVEKNDRKLAGILIETCAIHSSISNNQRYVVIGVGINLTQPTSHQTVAQPLLRTPAAWLQEFLPETSAPDTLQRIAFNLVQTILTFADHGFAPFQARFNQLDALKNRRINIESNVATTMKQVITTGIAQGVNHKGELILQTAVGIETINSSEVSIKPL